MKEARFFALVLLLALPGTASAGRGDPELLPNFSRAAPSPRPAPAKSAPKGPAPVEPLEELPEVVRPPKRTREPEDEDKVSRPKIVLRARAWMTAGSMDTRISKLDYLIGETEERGADGWMLVYSGEVAPLPWLSAEFQYGQDDPKGTYSDRFWVHAPDYLLFYPGTGAVWDHPDHEDDLVFTAAVSSRRDWVAGNLYVRVLELRNRRDNEPVWRETLDLAVGYERFRQDSSLDNLSVASNNGKYFSPGLALGPVPGFASRYSAVWKGPHIGFRNELEVPYGFSFEGWFFYSPFMTYRGEGFDNLGSYWLPLRDSAPNLVDTAKGTAVHFQLGARWDWKRLRLEAGYQRLYFYSRTGTRAFYGADGGVTNYQLDFATAEMSGFYAGAALRF